MPPDARQKLKCDNTNTDPTIKLLLLGDESVGKSSLMLRFCDDSFHAKMVTTIGIDFRNKPIEIDGVRLRLQIWDTAGQEKFKTLTQAYYRGAMGIFLVYDVTCAASFGNVCNWIDSTKQFATSDVCLMIIGNKCDCLPEERAVSFEQGINLAKKFDIPFLETSAHADMNVRAAFVTLARRAKDQQKLLGRFGQTKNPDRVNLVLVETMDETLSSSSECAC